MRLFCLLILALKTVALARLRRHGDARQRITSGWQAVHALAGQSGAGKSTLLNALHGFSLETGDVSQRIERGRHTTRHVSLIPVAGGGMALDTPGFSLFETELLDPVLLKDSYPEFAPHEGKCFFSPCYHDSEPRCAARRAADEGEIDKNRYERYRALLEDMKIRWRDRYG